MSGELLASGHISKLTATQLLPQVQYSLPLDQKPFGLNECLGQNLKFSFSGEIECQNCGRKTKKSYCQGHCYPCSQRLAACDLCILKPETCHYHLGSCREPEWGEKNCHQAHIIYLSNTSGLKVGITRKSQIPTRWLDQGAVAALAILEVDERLHAGQVEIRLAQKLADKTNWRQLLKAEPEPIDLVQVRDQILAEVDLSDLPVRAFDDLPEQHIHYPVLSYPEKIVSLNADKTPEISGKLMGIKGQYLIFDVGVINMRKYTGYQLSIYQNQ